MLWPEASTRCGLIISFPASILRIAPHGHCSARSTVTANHRIVLLLRLLLEDCLLRAMSSNLPIPVPPRTPTPPPDDPPDVPQPSSYDQSSSRLSPLTDTFPAQLSPLDAGSRDRLSPTKSSFGASPIEADSAQNGSNDDGSGPFNFKTVTMAKSPMIKSVS